MYYLSYEDWQHPVDSPVGKRYRAHALYILICRFSKLDPANKKRLAKVVLAQTRLDRTINSYLMDMHFSVIEQQFYVDTMDICLRVVEATNGLKVDANLFLKTIVTQLHKEILAKEEYLDAQIIVGSIVLSGHVAARALGIVARVTDDVPQSAIFNARVNTSEDSWTAILTFREDNITLYEFTHNGVSKTMDVGNKLLAAIFNEIPAYFFFTPLNEVQS